MKKSYYFISINNAVEVYEQKGSVTERITSAVKYPIDSDELWRWFENSVGELGRSHIYFLADEKQDVPEKIQDVGSGYSLSKLKSAMKNISTDCSLEVIYGADLSFYCHSKAKEKARLFLIYPSETRDESGVLEEETSEILLEEMNQTEGDSTTPLTQLVDENTSVGEKQFNQNTPSQKLATGEKSEIKKALEGLYNGYHTKK